MRAARTSMSSRRGIVTTLKRARRFRNRRERRRADIEETLSFRADGGDRACVLSGQGGDRPTDLRLALADERKFATGQPTKGSSPSAIRCLPPLPRYEVPLQCCDSSLSHPFVPSC